MTLPGDADSITKATIREGTNLAGRIVTAPFLVEPETARARVAAWLAGLDAPTGNALKARLSAQPLLRRLLESLSDSSPYLWDLASRAPERLLRLLDADPDRHLADLLARESGAAAATEDQAEAMRHLRRMKAEAALLIALADIGGVWPVMRATHALTELADAAVDAATRFVLAEAVRAGRLLPPDPTQPQIGSGYIVLAMGKMGAFELNYSSDIDLIVFYDKATAPLPDHVEPAQLFVRLTQRLVKLLQERTADGYVFRTDLRLRPDPASTAIAISTAAASSYYESVGQSWERAAMIKARACAGDLDAGAAMLGELSPFVWRKYLDYAAVADVHALKRQINAYRGHGEIAVEGHNIKLGRGGIREIEFFAQTQQLIAGGRHPDLRDRDTLTTLDKLAEGRWIEASARDDMKAAYCFLRTVEHRLQMVNDEQTQILPAERDGLERFARFLGFADRDAFAAVLLGHLDKVQRYYARLFESEPAADKPKLSFPPDTDDHKTLDRLAELGFRAPLETSGIVRNWLSGTYRSLKGEATQQHLQELLPVLLEQIARSDNPSAALIKFDGFLSHLHGAARLLSLLRQNPDLIALITLVLSMAPRLGDTVARYPQVMDALVDPSFFGTLPDEGVLTRRLDAALAQLGYDQDLLERIRMFGLEYMFLIGVRILSGTVTARQAGEAFARLADAVIRAVHRAVSDNFAATHGHMRGGETAVLAMGKLGGREMTASSDLDLILIYDFDAAAPGIERRTLALRRAIFRAADPAADQRADGADQLRRALPGRHAAAPVGARRPGGDADRELHGISGARGLDLGAHGADARTRGFGLARVQGAHRGRHRRRPTASARRRTDRRRRRGDARCDRQGKGRQGALGPQICRRRARRYRVHRAISAIGACRAAAGDSRHLHRARARQGLGLACADGGGCRGAAPGGAALSRPDADPAAVPAGAVRSQDGWRRAFAPVGACRRRAGLRHARCHAD